MTCRCHSGNLYQGLHDCPMCGHRSLEILPTRAGCERRGRDMSDDIAARRRDAEVGRRLRETAAAFAPDEPLVHVSWCTETGRTSGKYLRREPLYFERQMVSDALAALYEAAIELHAGEGTS